MKTPKLSPTQLALLQVLADGGRLETAEGRTTLYLYDRAGQPVPEVWVVPATLEKLFQLGLVEVTKQYRPAHVLLRHWGSTERGRDALAGRPWSPPETPPEIPEFRPGPPPRGHAEDAARTLAASLRLTTPLTPLWDERISPTLLETELLPWWTELILDQPDRAVANVLEDLFSRDPAFQPAWESLGPVRRVRAEILQKQVRQRLVGLS
jgi:hypothetical protein